MRRHHLAVLVLAGAAGVTFLSMTQTGIAQPSTPAQTGNRIAVVDTLSLVEEMLQNDQYASVREERADMLSEQVQQMENSLNQLQNQYQQIAGSDPASAQQIQMQFQQQYQQMNQFRQSSLAQFEQLSAGQAAEVYEQVRAAISEVASERGYTHVIASRTDTDMTGIGSLAAFTQEALARPVVVSPEGSDITVLVRESLGLPDPAEILDAVAPAEGEDASEDAADQDSPEGADAP